MISRAASFATMILGNREEVVWRVDGDSLEGSHYWSYVAVDKPRFAAFKKALASGNIRVQDYGKILAWGKGETPPEGTRQWLSTEYGLELND